MEWSPYYNKILALEAQGFSQSEIANTISEIAGEEVTRDMVRHAIVRARESIRPLKEMPNPERIPYVTKYMDYLTGEKRPEPKEVHRRQAILRKSEAKGLSLADIHIPFHDEEKVSEAIEKHRDSDFMLIVADLLDCYDISSFIKSIDVPFVFEMDEALRFLEYVSNNFYWTEALEANHEDRVRRTIESNLPPALQFLARTNILSVLAAPFPNIYVHSDLWFFQFGTGIFSHPSKASRVELRTAIEVYEHFKEWEEFYGLDEWNLIQVAHTHNMGVAYTSRAKVMETGALCRSMGYSLSPKIPYKRPQASGYSTVLFREGVADLNECREYKFPNEIYRGKP